MHATKRVTEALDHLKSAFLEGPQVRLSVDEASSLAGLDPPTCQQILQALQDVRFLRCERDGAFFHPMRGPGGLSGGCDEHPLGEPQ